MITSYVGHDQVRSAHRAAINSDDLRKLNMVRVFMLATIPSKEKFIDQNAIQNEHEHFNDIVQGELTFKFHQCRFFICLHWYLQSIKEISLWHRPDCPKNFTTLHSIQLNETINFKSSVGNFMESYRNLSYKHAMGLRWSAAHSCLKPKYIIKMDDDIVVDFFHLVHYLLTNNHGLSQSNNREHFLAGYIFKNVVPIRQRQNKWFVTTEEFAGSVYPSYLSGWMYVTTPYTARTLISAIDQSTPIFWIDDTWITGILRHKQRIPINDMLNDLFSANSQFLDCCLTDINKFKYRCPFVAGPNGGDHKMIEQFLKATQKHCFDMTLDIMNDRCIERDPKLPSLKKSCVGGDKHLLREDHGAAIVSAIRL